MAGVKFWFAFTPNLQSWNTALITLKLELFAIIPFVALSIKLGAVKDVEAILKMVAKTAFALLVPVVSPTLYILICPCGYACPPNNGLVGKLCNVYGVNKLSDCATCVCNWATVGGKAVVHTFCKVLLVNTQLVMVNGGVLLKI